jgi:hypothetical protein
MKPVTNKEAFKMLIQGKISKKEFIKQQTINPEPEINTAQDKDEIPKNKYYKDDGETDFWKSMLNYSKTMRIKPKPTT